MTIPNPKPVYSKRGDAAHAAHAAAVARFDLLANLRLVVFAVALAIAVAAWRGVLHPGWIALPVAVFAALVVWHARIERRRARARLLTRFYEQGLARLAGDWAGKGVPGDEHVPTHHPYATDLDLFGHGGLFELLCRAQTRHGENTLAAWLLHPAAADAARARQAAVAELRDALDLREDLAVLGRTVRAGVHEKTLRAWAEAPPVYPTAALPIVAALLAVAGAAALVFALAVGNAEPLLLVAVVDLAYTGLTGRRVTRVSALVDAPARELTVLAAVLARFEREQFAAALLQRAVQSLTADGRTASQCMAQLEKRVSMLDQARNQLFAPIAILCQWGVLWTWAIERWRLRHASRVPRWLDALGELEALLSLASHHFENPADPFPELIEGPAELHAEGLGHPLFPVARFVPNDVHLGGVERLLVVSGSNMSGKSTLLRSVGVNAVLAQAGAPVRSASLQMTSFAVGATIHVLDSIQEGASRFYAEIMRLKQLQDMARGGVPLLFLLDEILHGTNSHDRRVGAAAVLSTFIEAGAVGLVTTHDLAITAIADDPALCARNVHFEDHFAAEGLSFDYRLRDGVVQQSNALRLMRHIGLDVTDEAEE